MVQAIRNHDLYGITDRMGNVLESVTCPAYPVIDEIKAQMMKNGAVNAMMSGSGPTVFGICPRSVKNKRTVETDIPDYSIKTGRYKVWQKMS